MYAYKWMMRVMDFPLTINRREVPRRADRPVWVSTSCVESLSPQTVRFRLVGDRLAVRVLRFAFRVSTREHDGFDLFRCERRTGFVPVCRDRSKNRSVTGSATNLRPKTGFRKQGSCGAGSVQSNDLIGTGKCDWSI